MKKLLTLASIVAISTALTGCFQGERVSVNPAQVGKLLTGSGYQQGVIKPSSFRLNKCSTTICDKLVLLDTADLEKKETVNGLFMPQDDLMIDYDLRTILAVDPDEYELLFSKSTPTETENKRILKINSLDFYNKYAVNIIRTYSRTFLSKFSIEEINSNREKIGNELAKGLTIEIKNKTPFIARFVGLAGVTLPPVITKAKEDAAKKKEDIAKATHANKATLLSLKREKHIVAQQFKIDLQKANNEIKIMQKISAAVTPEYIKYKELEALMILVANPNAKFVPTSMLDGIAVQNEVTK